MQTYNKHKQQLDRLFEQRAEIEESQEMIKQLLQLESYLKCLKQLDELKKKMITLKNK